MAKELGGPIQIVGLWASPPCTEYSRAKTSMPYCQKEAAFEEADKLIRFTLGVIFELAAVLHNGVGGVEPRAVDLVECVLRIAGLLRKRNYKR